MRTLIHVYYLYSLIATLKLGKRRERNMHAENAGFWNSTTRTYADKSITDLSSLIMTSLLNVIVNTRTAKSDQSGGTHPRTVLS